MKNKDLCEIKEIINDRIDCHEKYSFSHNNFLGIIVLISFAFIFAFLIILAINQNTFLPNQKTDCQILQENLNATSHLERNQFMEQGDCKICWDKNCVNINGKLMCSTEQDCKIYIFQ
jgi:hypothetical protein